MFKKLLLASVLASSVTLSAQAAQTAVAPTIAVINVPYVMNEVPQSKAAQAKIQKDFAPRVKEIQDLETQGKKIAEDLQSGKLQGQDAVDAQRKFAQMQADFNIKARALQEDQQRRISQEQQKITVEIQKAIDTIAKERQIQLVIRGDAVAYTVNALDISQEVINRVAKSAK